MLSFLRCSDVAAAAALARAAIDTSCFCSCKQMSLLLLGKLQKLPLWGEKKKTTNKPETKPEEGSNIHFPQAMQCRNFLLPLTMVFLLLLWPVTSHGPGGSISFQDGTCTMRKDALGISKTQNISVFIETQQKYSQTPNPPDYLNN